MQPPEPGGDRVPCVWSGRVGEAAAEMQSDDFFLRCRKRYEEAGFGTLGDAEFRSWRNSWPPLLDALKRAQLTELQLYLEFATPGGSSRFDALLLGSTDHAGHVAVVIELKQWTDNPFYEEPPGRGFRRDVREHPVDQLASYMRLLHSWLKVDGPGLEVKGLVLLHNATAKQVEKLRRRDGKSDQLMFGNDDISQSVGPVKLREVFQSSDLLAPARTQIAQFEAGRWVLDTKVVAEAGRAIEENLDLVLVGGQRLAFIQIMDAVDAYRFGSNERVVVLVTGGPGSGKTVLAVKLLGRLFSRTKNKIAGVSGVRQVLDYLRVRYLTPSGTLRDNMRQAVRSSRLDARVIDELFQYPRSVLRNVDLAVVDEAHRLKRSLGAHRLLSVLLQHVPVTVLFLDERQIVRADEGISEEEVRTAAQQVGARVVEVKLGGCFRNNGSRDFSRWVGDLIDGRPSQWAGTDYDIGVADTPEELDAWVRGANVGKQRGRVTAGFCWPWTRSDPGRQLAKDVQIDWTDEATGERHRWCRPWNASGRGQIDGEVTAPEKTLWAYEPGGEGQIGCVYTAQGLEYERSGVILGDDFVRRGDEWVAIPGASRDPVMKNVSAEDYARYVRNIYRVLLTRGTQGCRVYSVDRETQDFLKILLPER